MTVNTIRQAINSLYPLGSGQGKVIVAGMPKSGTTAIAALLAASVGEKVCSDPFYRLDKQGVRYREKLFSGDYSLASLWRANRHVFKGEVVKDPNFPFFIADFNEFFPAAKQVFIVRSPFDNIRSILNRLELPANPAEGEKRMADFTRGGWFHVLNGVSPALPGNNYLERMAWRWRVSAEHYLRERESVRLIRYEDFRSDKVGEIKKLATDLGLKPNRDISELVDVQYQPKGRSSGSYEEFFDREHLDMIGNIVEPLLEPFGYGR
jgi:hypothetical protein